MKFALLISSKDDKEHAVIPKLVMDGINAVLDAHGFKVSLMIPETKLGKKFRTVLMAAMQAKQKEMADGRPGKTRATRTENGGEGEQKVVGGPQHDLNHAVRRGGQEQEGVGGEGDFPREGKEGPEGSVDSEKS